MVPPHPPVGADGNDPIHPDDYGPPPEDDVNLPPGGANDSGEQDDDSDWDMDDPNLDPPQNGQPPFPPHPPPSLPPSMPSVAIPTPQQPMFSNPDDTVEQIMQPVADEESSSKEPHITEPERVEKSRDMYHMTPTRNRQRLRQRFRLRNRKYNCQDIRIQLKCRRWNHRMMKKMMNHIRRQQVQMIRRFLCLQQRLTTCNGDIHVRAKEREIKKV